MPTYKLSTCHKCHTEVRFVGGAFATVITPGFGENLFFFCEICALTPGYKIEYWCSQYFDAEGRDLPLDTALLQSSPRPPAILPLLKPRYCCWCRCSLPENASARQDGAYLYCYDCWQNEEDDLALVLFQKIMARFGDGAILTLNTLMKLVDSRDRASVLVATEILIRKSYLMKRTGNEYLVTR